MVAPHLRGRQTWMVVGLGNPGPRYAGNRHNVGAMVLDQLAERHVAAWGNHKKAGVDLASYVEPALRVRLVHPRSFMNTSGPPVQRAMAFEKVGAESLVVVHDELDLPFGSIRLKLGGGDNGHNGLRSVRQALGTGEFYRVRVGIGRPSGPMRPADFVLHDFSASERRELPEVLLDGADAVEGLMSDGLAATQNVVHARG
jgi:PTH1 family peptidyl-tRNA hydrolase